MKIKSIAVLLALCAAITPAGAANISYTGQFTYDNDVQLINFSVDALSMVGLRTWSYAGGVNAAGQVIARGGFDPIVALFDASGQLVGEQDDAGCGKVGADAVSRQCWDINYTVQLAAGNYTVSLQQWNNYHVGTNLAEGFYFQDAQYQHFRDGFVDEIGQRNSAWALDLMNVSLPAPAGQVPEPASLLLAATALAGIAATRRRKPA